MQAAQLRVLVKKARTAAVNATRTSRSLVLLLPLLGLFALAFTGCPAPEWPKCEKDDHCAADKKDNPSGKDQVCVFGQCQECGRDTDCGSGQRCSKGRCEAVCTADADCGQGEMCNPQGECVRDTRAAITADKCVEDGDCKSGFRCVNKSCVEDSAVTPTAGCDREARILFGFNVYDLSPESRETLDRFAKCMQDNQAWRLTVEGHADERGTTQYNLDLGDKRARSVADYLSRLGVPKSHVRTVSFGEERPLVNRSDESAWEQNRRGELVIK
jgi:peptidoglycan-associated lipoprotein